MMKKGEKEEDTPQKDMSGEKEDVYKP